MMEQLRRFFAQSWLITLRRLVMLMFVFVALGYLAYYAREWEFDLYGCAKLYVPLAIITMIGCAAVPLLGIIWGIYVGLRCQFRRRKAKREVEQAGAEEMTDDGVQLQLPLSYPPSKEPGRKASRWDIWLALWVVVLCVPLCYFYHYRASQRSMLTVSCAGVHGDSVVARAEWLTAGAPAEGVKEHMAPAEPYLHTFYLPDGDFSVSCESGTTAFSLSHIRETRRFTLKPRFNIEGDIDLYICPIVHDNDRKRVRTLLQYYVQNPQSRRPRIRRMPFTKCQDSAVLYLDYGEYVLLPVPVGTELSEAPALIYLSLLP